MLLYLRHPQEEIVALMVVENARYSSEGTGGRGLFRLHDSSGARVHTCKCDAGLSTCVTDVF